MKKVFLIAILFLMGGNIYGQNSIEKFDEYYKVGITIGLNRLSQPSLSNKVGDFHPEPVNAYNPNLEIQYDLFPRNRFSILLGAQFSLVPTQRFSLFIPYDKLNFPNNLDIKYVIETDHSHPALTIPISISYKGLIIKNIFYNFNIGGEFSYLFSSMEENYTTGEYTGGDMSKPIDFDNAPLLRFTYKSGKQFNQSLSASAGLKFATKALLIGTDLIFSYNIGDIIKEGKYTITDANHLTIGSGNYSSDLTYIGLKLSFRSKKFKTCCLKY